MSYRLTGCLGCTGILALLVFVFPALVTVGLYAGGVPGLILEFTPGLFGYLLAWWGISALVVMAGTRVCNLPASDVGRKALRTAAGGLAILILAVPAVLVPRAINASLADIVTTMRVDDRETSGPLSFPPIIAILLKDNYDLVRKKLYCETLCQRLLYNGAVSRIIVADGLPPRAVDAFWIERRDRCPDPALASFDIIWPGDLQRGSSEQRARARVAAGECLLEGAGNLEEAGVIISFRNIKEGVRVESHPWTLQLDTASANRLEIVKADGGVLYRRTEVTTEPLTVPIIVQTRPDVVGGYTGWARSKMTYASIGPRGRDVLPALLGSAARPPDYPGP